MSQADPVRRTTLRRHYVFRFVSLWFFGIVLALAALAIQPSPAASRAMPATSSSHEIALQLQPVMATHRSAQHPCGRGVASVIPGACAISAASAGLIAGNVEQMSPTLTATSLNPKPFASLPHQWRGGPPDRPPRS